MTEESFESDNEIFLEFVAESIEHLEGIDQQLVEYEKNPQDSTLIDGIFRAIHSIKGGSGFLQLEEVNKLSHRLETLLDLLRKGEKSVSSEIMDVLFKGCDILRCLVEEANERLDNKLEREVARDNQQLRSVHETLSKILDIDATITSTGKKGTPDNAQPEVQPSYGYTINPQLLQEFQIEASDHLESCDQGLLRLSETPDDVEAVNSVFRDMHSIKGTASYLGLTGISELAHAAESMLEILRREEKLVLSDEVLDLLFDALDRLKEMVADPNSASEKACALAHQIVNKKTALEKNGTGSMTKASVRRSLDPLSIFLDAAEQHISTLKECIARQDEGKDGEVEMDMMFRAAHSLKSSARYMNFGQVEAAASTIEEVLSSVRNGEVQLAPAIFTMVENSVADIERSLADIEGSPKNEVPLVPSVSEKSRQETTASGPALKRQALSSAAEQKAAPPKTMRVNQELLDTFMNLVGELIVARNAFGHIERRLEIDERERSDALKELRGASLAVARISEEMQRTVMEMRMVPIRNVFQKFPRMVRDLTRKNGKQTQIILQGEETEIDKGIAEELADPLVHIIRNSVDHGLEGPDERKRAGKSETGTIILRATHEGNFIVIEIMDDGRGINTEAVLDKAIEKGLVNREQAASLNHEEICGFIFKPGFSTAQKVTDISGRGVGMDVVMTNLKKLKGNVRVTSETGQGTKVRLEVPLTLALVDALLVQIEGQTFAMPLEAVAETVKVRTDLLKSLMKEKAITLRGEVVSVADLADMLGVNRIQGLGGDELTLLILKLGGNRLGVIVDRIQRKEEIVVKPLADYLTAIPGLAGASILGDGRSILILEPAELMAAA